MNIKKNLSLLSATILLASNAHAIPANPGGNAVVVLNTAGQGSFWMDSGVSADDIARDSAGFSINLSAASAALGGTIEQFAILGFSSATPTNFPGPNSIFNYDEFVYVDPGAGLVYATSNPSPASSNVQLINQLNNVQQFVENASFGFNPEGSLGDVDNNAHIVFGLGGLLNDTSDSTVLYHQYQNLSSPATLGRTSSVYGQVLLQGNQQLIVTGVPVPASAWLFISALGGLTVIRRAKKARNQCEHNSV